MKKGKLLKKPYNNTKVFFITNNPSIIRLDECFLVVYSVFSNIII